jgi:hypothetical protein
MSVVNVRQIIVSEERVNAKIKMRNNVRSQVDKRLRVVIACSRNSISVSRKANTEGKTLASIKWSLHTVIMPQ